MLLAVVASSAVGETWETMGGRRVEGKLSGVYGPVIVIAEKNGSTILLLSELKDAELNRVADFLAARPANPPSWAVATSKVAKSLKGRLQVLRGDKLVDFDPGTRVEPNFYLIYFGAEWCPPCRAFSPKLVTESQRLKQLAPDKFELVFVSSDRESAEQLKYVRHVAMPWPVLKYSHLGRAEPIERWAGNGIPCLVAVTGEGEAVFHSYRGTEYVGPQDVLTRFESLLRAMASSGTAGDRSLHRLAVLQHVRAAGGTNKPAAPYAVTLDYRRYRTLDVKEVIATLDIDEAGRVQEASLDPELPTVLNFQLLNDVTASWLFLPSVENGRAVRKTVKLPLKLGGE
jgi:thiol-disulfide isomerase/thioredoxin